MIIKVNVSKGYEVKIGRGLLPEIGETLTRLLPKAEKAAIITDTHVGPIYAASVQDSLSAAGISSEIIELPYGEQHKNIDSYIQIMNRMAELTLTRTDAAIALGGGVIGDMTGFAAATFLRGISYIQIPTSLLAMVDSSVGGKTAIDLASGKNLAGAFCQPTAVLCDVSCLDTLPEYFLVDGLAEAVKAGILKLPDLFRHLSEKGKDFDREYVISQCIAMKRDYVEEDEFDTSVRRELNLGHTVGHAVEKYSNFTLSHGRGVSIGTAVIAGAAAAAGFCSLECAEKIVSTLKSLELPVHFDYPEEEIIRIMLNDKKRKGSALSFVVPLEIGHCRMHELNLNEIAGFLRPGFEFAASL